MIFNLVEIRFSCYHCATVILSISPLNLIKLVIIKIPTKVHLNCNSTFATHFHKLNIIFQIRPVRITIKGYLNGLYHIIHNIFNLTLLKGLYETTNWY